MSEVSAQALDRRQLLLADGEFSLSALQRSLKVGGHASGEASLHVMDLSSLLAAFGLRPQAQLLKDLAQNLSEDPQAVAGQVEAVLPQLKSLMQALQSDRTDEIQAAGEALRGSLSASSPPASEPIAPAPLASPSPAEPAQIAPADPVGRWAEPAPYFSAGLAAAPYAAAKPQEAAPPLSQAPYQSSWTALRAQVLHTVQDAGLSVQPDGQHSDAATSVLLKLTAVQDALVRVGQLPVRSVLRDVDGADDVWADPPVLELLEHLQVFSQRASRISLQPRNLMVFVHWLGATLSQAELEHIGQKVADADGRVEFLDTGVQLVLPLSTQRMRMVSYRQGGQWHAVSQAQFVGWERSASLCRLKLRCGVRDSALDVQAPGLVSNMNLYPWPALVPAPVGLQGVALDAAGQVHLVRRHPA